MFIYIPKSYAQDSCSAPSCPSLSISGPAKVSYGESKSYKLTGASSSHNIRWSVDNPNASISGNNNGATLTVGSACNCNNGAIKITAKDTLSGCLTTFQVQAGTWLQIGYEDYSDPRCSPEAKSCASSRDCYETTSDLTYTRWTYNHCAKTGYWPNCGCPENICPPCAPDCNAGFGAYCGGQEAAIIPSHYRTLAKKYFAWKCPTASQSCSTPCSLGIAYFKSSVPSFDPYSETICLSGLVDEATGRSISWKIEIKNGAGEVVKQFSGGASYAAVSWNGRDGSGNIVPGGNYTAYLTAKTSDGRCAATSTLAITVESCDLTITKNANSVIINPNSGGSVKISGVISDSSGEPISWKITLPNGEIEEGTGTDPSAIWNGKRSNGTVMKPEIGETIETTATIKAWRTNSPSCTKSEKVNIKIEWSGGCLQVNVGSSANLASGNLSHNQELFTTKGTGLTTNLTLYYNSLDSYTGTLGRGWTHTYDIAIGESGDGYVVLREGDGGRKVYTKDGNNYISQAGDYATLIKNTDGTFTITHKDGLKYNFNTEGKISSIVDRNNNTMTFAYTNGDLITIADSSGRITALSYNTDHGISIINDPNGNTHSLSYSGNDLIGVSTLNSELGTLNWVYSYYNNSFMHTKTDPNGYTTTYTYDQDYRLATSTDPEGNIKSISYPSIYDTSQSKTTTVTEKDGGNWTYSYDTQAGTLTQKTDPENGTTSYTYDANRNMTSKTEADGSVTSYTYDAQGNMTSTTDALNQTTAYTYNSYGQVTSVTAPDNTTTNYEYDAKGNLTQIKDAAGQITTYSYDSRGNVVQITNAQGQTTKFTYDQNNNLSSVTDPTGATTSFTYDTAGNMTSQTDASGNTTRFEYNSLGRLIRVIDPSGNSTNSTYDANGNKTSETDANGNVTYYEYNYKGQLIKVKDALGNVTTYTYGGTGCSSCGGGTDKLTVITDANGNATKYEYDTLGRLTKETDPLGNAISYSYDSKGNLISKTDANGTTTNYSYDGLGRLLKKAYPDNTTETFTYDTKGNILTATNANTSYSFTYNTSGKATSVTDSSGRTVSYQYDTLGNRTKLTYPEGSVVTYSYDSANRLTSMVNGNGKTYTYSYDNSGRRTKLSLPNGTSASYSYDTSGRLTSLINKTSSGSVITQYSYTHDKVGNRLSRTNTETKNTYGYDAIYRLLQSLPTKLQGKDKEQVNKAETFVYDPVGNRLTGPETKDTYLYNPSNQLTSDRNHQYEYDKNGNLIKKTEREDDGETEVWTYAYDYENRLIKVVKQEEDETKTVTFKYDPFGRRIEKKVEEAEDGETETKIFTYVYDNEDVILEYLTKTEDNESKTEATKYVHGPGIDEPLAIERKGEVYCYHADGLGSITALTDKKQKVVESYTYSAFGEVKRKGDKVKNTYTFTGREWDEEIGLYYYRARYYDPKIGRFTSYDPLLHPANGPPAKKGCGNNPSEPSFNAFLSRPLELNPYIYTLDSPTNHTDPYGKAIISPYPLLPPSLENCAHYKRDADCGSLVARAAYSICLNSPNNTWFNCVRSCLKEKYLSRVSDAIWLTVDHPVCYLSCPGGLLGN